MMQHAFIKTAKVFLKLACHTMRARLSRRAISAFELGIWKLHRARFMKCTYWIFCFSFLLNDSRYWVRCEVFDYSPKTDFPALLQPFQRWKNGIGKAPLASVLGAMF